MILKGVDQINGLTERPDRVEGKWKPGKLLRTWNSYFAKIEPSDQATLKADDEQEIVNIWNVQSKSKGRKGKMIFNIKLISASGEVLLTGLKDKKLDDI